MAKHTKEMITWVIMGRTGGLTPILLGCFCFGLAVSATPAGADVVTSTWIGGNPGAWGVAGNWSPSGVPNNTGGIGGTQYNVIIDDPNEGPYIGGLTIPSVTINSLSISNSSGYVDVLDGGSLELKNSGGLSSQGTVKVQAGGMLLLNGGTVTSAKIELIGITGTAKRAKLRINSDTSLAATATEIVGSDPDDTSGLPTGSPQTPDGLIDGDGKLTLPVGGTIRGELEIQAKLANNGLVDADEAQGKIYLTSTSKSGGSGADFKATAGLLEVNATVTGSADWTASGTGFLFVTSGGDISGKDLDILAAGGNNAGIRIHGPVTLSGNLDTTVDIVEPQVNHWYWFATCTFTGGTAESPVTLELASEDIWSEPADWDVAWPYSSGGMGLEVIIGPDAHLKGVDIHDNGNTGGVHCEQECLFVTTLTFADGDGRYDRNGFDAHYDVINGNVSQILGSGCN
ncbi:MAG: hypothetical protein IID41_15255 [Planctomycetes bacterium]|nr:hypothetical protein [Planctomycetota bacterium]